jgi:hypothetical protein
MIKLCKECNWHKNNDYYYTGSGIHDECLCPEIKQELNPVTGELIMKFCRFERLKSGKCGPDAKFWEEKEPPKPKKGFWANLW